jgi:predicted nicotinamide N-methyase
MLDLELLEVCGLRLWLVSAQFPRGPLPADLARLCWEEPPFWAFVWPGGHWLSKILPQLPVPGVVVDLGSGSGILSLALTRAGWRCWAVDSDPKAREMTSRNASENGLAFPVVASLEEVTERPDLIILADFLYDPANLGQLLQLQKFCPEILLADCRLHQVPPGFVALPAQAQRVIPDLDWNDDFNQLLAAATPKTAAWASALCACHLDPKD